MWGKTRGWGYPLFLWLSSLIFGESSYGLAISCFIIFVIFYFYINKMQELIEYKNVYRIFLIPLLIFNPIILGYYHFMLTESLSATICAFVIYKIIYYQKDLLEKHICKCIIVKKICLVAFSCTLLYFIKQMFFIIPVLASLFSDIWLVIKKKLSYFYLFTCFFIILILLFFSNKCWNTFLNSEAASTPKVQIEDTIFSNVNVTSETFFNVYLIKGATNFKHDSSNQTIIVYNQDKAVDTLQYFDSENPVKYIFTCLINHPILLLKGYFDGYGALANAFSIKISPGESASSGKIIKDFSLIRGYENYHLACSFRYLDYNFNTYDQLGRGDKLIQFGQYTDSNLVTKTIYSPSVIPFYNFTFTLSILYAPIAMIWHAIASWIKRKKENANFHVTQFVLAGTTFFYGMALSVMCMHIDRYMFPVYSFAMIVLINDIVYGYRKIHKRQYCIKKDKNSQL